MLQSFLTFLRYVVGIGSIIGVFWLTSRFMKDIWKRIAVAVLSGLFIAAIFTDITKTQAEKQQDAAQAETNKQQQLVEQKKQKKAEKVAAKKEPVANRLNISAEEREKAKAALQKFTDEGLIMKVENHGDSLVSVWVDRKFSLLPYDMKTGMCYYVCAAYFKSKDGFIGLVDGYTGQDIGSYSLEGGLKIK
jgi:hypothetical protein